MTTTVQPVYNPNNVVVGQAQMYYQPLNRTLPAVLPPDTQGLNVVWPAPWKPIGATTDGLSFDFKRDGQSIQIEEQMTAVDVRTKGLDWTANFEMSEDTLEAMKLGYGGGTIITTPAATGKPGVSVLVIGSEMDDIVFAFEGCNEVGLPRRFMIPRTKSTGDIKTPYRRADAQRSYPISLQSLVDPKDVVIRNIDAPAL